MNRLYFDYNSTTPLATSVVHFLKNADIDFRNASSIHASGKKAKRILYETEDVYREAFQLNRDWELYFHSGATEGLNSLVMSLAHHWRREHISMTYLYSPLDHSCLVEQVNDLEADGHLCHSLKIDEQGNLDLDFLRHQLSQASAEHPILCALTWVNNELGLVNPMEDWDFLEHYPHCFFLVDAVQAPGRIENYTDLPLRKSCAYVFSGHKFGALKGVGVTLHHQDFPIYPYLRGGGQQRGLRSGTENILGIHSLALALQDLKTKFNPSTLKEAKAFLDQSFLKLWQSSGEILAFGAQRKNLNTIALLNHHHRSDKMLAALDLAGIEASSGSACSSGALGPNRLALALGYSEEQARNTLRFSFSPYTTLEEARDFWPRIEAVLQRFTS